MSTVDSPRLFVYYRVAAARRAGCIAAAQAMQRSLCESHAGLKAELLQRPAAPGEPTLTLMETYTLEPLGIGAALQARIEAEAQAALARWIEGPRHTEVFAACA